MDSSEWFPGALSGRDDLWTSIQPLAWLANFRCSFGAEKSFSTKGDGKISNFGTNLVY